MKFLIVDDSATMRRIVIRTLMDSGFTEFVEAENGQAGLEVYAKGGVEMVITDWNMPVMNGLEFVTALRKLNANIPILMVTTNAANLDVIAALKAGVNNYVVKPFTPAVMKEKVMALLEE